MIFQKKLWFVVATSIVAAWGPSFRGLDEASGIQDVPTPVIG